MDLLCESFLEKGIKAKIEIDRLEKGKISIKQSI